MCQPASFGLIGHGPSVTGGCHASHDKGRSNITAHAPASGQSCDGSNPLCANLPLPHPVHPGWVVDQDPVVVPQSDWGQVPESASVAGFGLGSVAEFGLGFAQGFGWAWGQVPESVLGLDLEY